MSLIDTLREILRPSSLPVASHPTNRDQHIMDDSSHPMDSHLTPYLGLRARLSQVWINRWTILLLLVLVRVLIACGSLDNDIDKARIQALSACSGVENVGSAMASMPHYLSVGVNQLAATGVEKAISGLMEGLELTVTGVEEIAVFVVNLMTSTYLCLITLAVTGSVHAGVHLLEEAMTLINGTLKTIAGDLASGVAGFEKDLNGFISGIGSIFGDSSPPTLNLQSEISALSSVSIPSSVNAELSKLNASMPSFDQVQTTLDNILRDPFEYVKGKIQEAAPNYTVDASLFPVPAKQQLTFCTDNNGINDFFQGLTDVANTARTVFLGVLIAIAVLACVPMTYQEIRRWRTMQERAKMIQTTACDPLDVVYIASRPYTASAGLTFAKAVPSNRGKILARWAVAYATTTPALYVLSLGVAGLLACLCQYILLRVVQKEVPVLANEVHAFAEKVVNALDEQSVQWAIATNSVINATNAKVNNDLFGWVNTSTTALNQSLNAFSDDMTTTLKDAFGGTILYGPVEAVFECLVELKIQGIEKALTWAQDHAHIDFPLFPVNVFSAGAAASVNGSAPSGSILAGADSNATDEITASVVSLTQTLEAGVRQEAIIAGCVVLIWFIIALIGIIRAVFAYFGSSGTVGDDDTIRLTNAADYDGAGCRSAEKSAMDIGVTQHDDTFTNIPLPEQSRFAQESNQYKGYQYTLDPRPFPRGNPGTPSAGRGLEQIDEKIGYVGARPVDSVVYTPTHTRKSSYADLNMTTPSIGVAKSGNFESRF